MNFRRYRFAMRGSVCRACGQRVCVVDGADLRRVRVEAGLSLRAMGKRIGFSASYLRDVELNRRTCTTRIEEAYGVLALLQVPDWTADEAAFVDRREL